MEDVLDRVEELVASQETEEAQKLLLSVAGELGLDDRFQALLERAAPDALWRRRPPELRKPANGPWGDDVFVPLDQRPNPNHLAYGLPELGRIDASLLTGLSDVDPDAIERRNEYRFAIAGQPLFGFTPARADNIRSPDGPWVLGYTHEHPSFRIDDPGVLLGRQDSRYDAREYWSQQWRGISVYRVRGLLLHVRKMQFNYSSPGED